MKAYFSWETTTLLSCMVITTGVVIIIAWIVNDGTPASRIVLTAGVSVAFIGLTTLWKLPAFRVLLHKLRHRINSPTYEIVAGGVIYPGVTTDENGLNDSELLDIGFSVTKRMHEKAIQEAKLANRIVIRADRSRSIIFDVQRETTDDEYTDDWNESQKSQMNFNMRGYTGNTARTKKILDHEIGPFMNHLVDETKAHPTGRNFWLHITMEHSQYRNPLLMFYLRDVPTTQVELFQLHLIDQFDGEPVRVLIHGDGFNISTRTVDGLMDSTKRHLSNLALPHSNSD